MPLRTRTERQEKLDQLLGRIARLTGQEPSAKETAPNTPPAGANEEFFPARARIVP